MPASTATSAPSDDPWPVLTAEDTEDALRDLIGERRSSPSSKTEREIDLSHEIPGVARFRINAFRQRGGISLVARAIPHRIRTIEELTLPPVIARLAEEQRGIILAHGDDRLGQVDDARGDDRPHQRPRAHIVTIEDPIEFVHNDLRSVISQREVGMDTASFKRALRRVLRQDPDVILIGEMRDEETVQTAMSAAETGHLVLSTIHTVDAAESINRMLDFFPPHHHRRSARCSPAR